MDSLYPCYTDVPGGYRVYWHDSKEIEALLLRRSRKRIALKLGFADGVIPDDRWAQYCLSIGVMTNGKKL